MNEQLANEFEDGLRGLYQTIVKEAKYKPTLLLHMIEDTGGLTAAKRLINKANVSYGHTELKLKQRLDLTVEAFVINNPQWHALFTAQELEKARERLEQLK